MKKIMNNPNNIVDEMLLGMEIAHSDLISLDRENRIIYRKKKCENKVGLISGGGSGHEPSHAGFVGEGMLSAAISGAIFTSPGPEQIFEAIKLADTGAGVFMIIKNYSGDIMNFEIAQELAQAENIEVESVVVSDDIAVEDSLYTQGRRGVAGTVLVHKIVGYWAAQGKSLIEIKKMAESLVKNIKTIGIALSGVTTPDGGRESFNLDENTIEYGVGIHGEPGYNTHDLVPSKELAKELSEKILNEFDVEQLTNVGVLVNGLGATPLLEQYVFLNDVNNILTDRGINIEFIKVGDLMTSLDMAGLSLTIISIENDEITQALKSPVNTIAW